MKHNKRKLKTYIIVFMLMSGMFLWANAIEKGMANPIEYKQKLPDSFVTKLMTKLETALHEISPSDNMANTAIINTKPNLVKATVEYVKDGDTIVTVIDNVSYTVRMIGIDTPESVHTDASKNTDAGKEASAYTKTQLKEHDTIWLQADTLDVDEYGRLLRYIWLSDEVDTHDRKYIEKYMYNAILLAEQIAVPMTIEPNIMYKNTFQEIYEKN